MDTYGCLSHSLVTWIALRGFLGFHSLWENPGSVGSNLNHLSLAYYQGQFPGVTDTEITASGSVLFRKYEQEIWAPRAWILDFNARVNKDTRIPRFSGPGEKQSPLLCLEGYQAGLQSCRHCQNSRVPVLFGWCTMIQRGFQVTEPNQAMHVSYSAALEGAVTEVFIILPDMAAFNISCLFFWVTG